MRLAPIALFLAAVAPAFAQVSADEQPIQDAFNNIRLEQSILLRMDGSDTFSGKTTDFLNDAFWDWQTGATETVKADVQESRNGLRVMRTCGDGTVLWGYSYGKNEYTNTRYGSYSGKQPEGYRSTFLQNLSGAVQGPSIFLTRMLREIYSGEYAQYRSWMPGADVTVIAKGNYRDDPVVKRTYTSDDDNFYILYTYQQRPLRSLAFHFTQDSKAALPKWQLSEVYYADKQGKIGQTRVLDWRVTVYTGLLPASSNFVFVPPTNSRAVANARVGG